MHRKAKNVEASREKIVRLVAEWQQLMTSLTPVSEEMTEVLEKWKQISRKLEDLSEKTLRLLSSCKMTFKDDGENGALNRKEMNVRRLW